MEELELQLLRIEARATAASTAASAALRVVLALLPPEARESINGMFTDAARQVNASPALDHDNPRAIAFVDAFSAALQEIQQQAGLQP